MLFSNKIRLCGYVASGRKRLSLLERWVVHKVIPQRKEHTYSRRGKKV